jgi:outer membrane protein
MILNGILLIAVGYLYVLHFKKPDSSGNASSNDSGRVMLPAAEGIVFVNSDSLLDQYDYYSAKKKEFEAQQDRIKGELKQQSDRLQQEIEQYQQQAAGMTEAQRAQKEEQLTMKQQQLLQRKEELLDKLDKEQNNSSEELFLRLNNFFKKYNSGKNYNFILGFQKGGGILFANDSLNITREVIEGLNREYAGEKK